MELKECNIKINEYHKCAECKGIGEVTTMESVYSGADSHIQAPIGTEKCENCSGTGKEQDDQIVLERILEDDSIIEELQKIFNEYGEYGGRGITKDNCIDLFENWLSDLDLEEVTNLIAINSIKY